MTGLTRRGSRGVYRAGGALLVLLVVGCVGGLLSTRPPNVQEMLAFASPTPFWAWGVIAMCAVLMEGAMEPVSEAVLCAVALLATVAKILFERIGGRRAAPRQG